MKKRSTLLTALCLAAALFASCGARQQSSPAPQPPQPATSVAARAEAKEATQQPATPLDVRDDEVVWGTLAEPDEERAEEVADEETVLSSESEAPADSYEEASPLTLPEVEATPETARPRRVTPTAPVQPSVTDEPRVDSPEEAGTTTSTSSSPSSPASAPSVGRVPGFEAPKPAVAENGSVYGEISPATGRPKTVHVEGYYRKDGTYVRGHYRSAPRRRN